MGNGNVSWQEQKQDFKGTGKLRCHICGGKLVTHEVGLRCPEWDGVLNARLGTAERGAAVSSNALRKRESRAKAKEAKQ